VVGREAQVGILFRFATTEACVGEQFAYRRVGRRVEIAGDDGGQGFFSLDSASSNVRTFARRGTSLFSELSRCADTNLNHADETGEEPRRIRADEGSSIFHQRLGFTCGVNAGFTENRRPYLTYSEIPLSASCSNCGM
jgi:hypothetical protein